MTDVVLDSGPLIHLSELDALDVICDFSSLFIPEAVRDEVGRHQPIALKHSLNLHFISCKRMAGVIAYYCFRRSPKSVPFNLMQNPAPGLARTSSFVFFSACSSAALSASSGTSALKG